MPYLVHSINNLFNVDNSGTGYFKSGVISSGDIYMRGALVATGLVLRTGDTGVLTGSFYPYYSNPRSYVTTGEVITGRGVIDSIAKWVSQSGIRESNIRIVEATTLPIVTHASVGQAATSRMGQIRIRPNYYTSSSPLSASPTPTTDNSFIEGWDLLHIYSAASLPTGAELILNSALEDNYHALIYCASGAFTIKNSGNMRLTADFAASSGHSLKLFYDLANSAWREEYRYPSYTGYLTGYVSVNDTGNFVLNSQTGIYTGSFYPLNSNPSGYLTTTTAGGVRNINVTGATVSGNVVLTGLGSVILTLNGQQITFSGLTGYYPYSSNPSGYVTTGQTGQFYAASNPNGYITSSALTPYVLTSSTGSYNNTFYSIKGGQVSGAVSGQNIISNKYGIGAGLYTFYKQISGGDNKNIFSIYNRYGAISLQSTVNGAGPSFSIVKQHSIVSQSGSSPVIMLMADVGAFNTNQDFSANYFSTGNSGVALNITNQGTVTGDFLVTVLLGGSFYPMNLVEF